MALRKTGPSIAAAHGEATSSCCASSGARGKQSAPSRFWVLQALWISYFCVAVCLVLGAAVCAAGVLHTPPVLSLVAIGFDMLLDMLSSCAVIWRFQGQPTIALGSSSGAGDGKGGSGKRRVTLTLSPHEEKQNAQVELGAAAQGHLEQGTAAAKDASSLPPVFSSVEVGRASAAQNHRHEGGGAALANSNAGCGVCTEGTSAAVAHRERVGTLIVGVLFILMSVWVFTHSALEVYAHHLACSAASTEKARALLLEEAHLSAQVTLAASLPCGFIFGVLAAYKFLIASKLSSRVMRADARNSAAGALLSVTAGIIAAFALAQSQGRGTAVEDFAALGTPASPPSTPEWIYAAPDLGGGGGDSRGGEEAFPHSLERFENPSIEAPAALTAAPSSSPVEEAAANEANEADLHSKGSGGGLASHNARGPASPAAQTEAVSGVSELREVGKLRGRPRLASASPSAAAAALSAGGAATRSQSSLESSQGSAKAEGFTAQRSSAAAQQTLPPSYDGIAAMVLSAAFFFEGVLSLRHLQKM